MSTERVAQVVEALKDLNEASKESGHVYTVIITDRGHAYIRRDVVGAQNVAEWATVFDVAFPGTSIVCQIMAMMPKKPMTPAEALNVIRNMVPVDTALLSPEERKAMEVLQGLVDNSKDIKQCARNPKPRSSVT